MAYSEITYSADGGVKDFTVTFDYLDGSHVYASVDKVITTESGSNYTASLIGSTTMRVTKVADGDPPPAGAKVRLFRITPIDQPAVVFGAGASLSSGNLNKNSEYLTYALQEATDNNDGFTARYLGAFDSAPETDNKGETLIVGASYWDTMDSMLKFWDGASWQHGNTLAETIAARNAAQTAASAASTSETNASNSASSASTSATNASNSASAASTSESNAATSETNAAQSETKAEAWAKTAEDVEVETGQYSALHHSAKADASASSASTSETNAANSASEVEEAAATASTQAGLSASSADISATQAGIATTQAGIAASEADRAGDETLRMMRIYSYLPRVAPNSAMSGIVLNLSNLGGIPSPMNGPDITKAADAMLGSETIDLGEIT